MRLSLAFATFLLCALSGNISPVAAQDKAEPEQPEAAPDPGDGKSLQLVLETGGHTAGVTQALFTRDGKQAITVSLDKTIRVWDLASGQTVRVLRPPCTTGAHGKINDAALSPDGQTLAVSTVAYQDKKWVGLVHLIRLSDGQIERTLERHKESTYAAVAFSPDGLLLAASAANRSGIRIWDCKSGELKRELAFPKGGLIRVAFSPDGKLLASSAANSSGIRIWDWKTGKLEQELAFSNKGKLICAAFSPDGQLLAGGYTHHYGQVLDFRGRVWSCKTGKVLHEFGTRHTVQSVAWSPDSQSLAFCHTDQVEVLKREGDSFQELWKKKGHPSQLLAFTPDGRQLLHVGGAAGNLIVLRDARTGEMRRDARTGKEQPLFALPEMTDSANIGALSPDGRLLIFTERGPGSPQDVVVHATADGKRLHQLAGKGQVLVRAVWTADGNGVAWASKRPAKGAEPVYSRSFNLAALEFGPEVRDQFQGTIHKSGPWAVQKKGDHLHVLKEEKLLHSQFWDNPRMFTLLREGDYVAWVGGMEIMRMANTSTGKVLRDLQGHSALVTALAASPPTGRYLLSTGLDQMLHVWNPEQEKTLPRGPLRPLLSLFVAGDEWVAWTQEGYYAASPGGEKLIGWVADSGPNKMMTFHPAQRFRNQMYRPEVIKLVLEKGSVEEALKAANVAKQDIEKLLPPQASLQHKQAGARVTVVTLVQASARTQPVAELHLLVDGRPARLENGKAAVKVVAPEQPKDVEETWTITLAPGRHKLSVRAVAKDTYSISEEVSLEDVKPTLPAPRNTRQGTLYYVGVGVNQFQHHPELKLNGAVPDVLALEKCLKESCKERFVAVKPTVLTDKEATREAILKTLTGLQDQLKPTDVVIVHYSSHGAVDREGGLFLLSHDSKTADLKNTAVPGQKLRDALGQYPSPVLLILDACHSGAFPLRSVHDPLSRVLADDSCGVAVMTAALAHQKAIDTDKGGLFTQALIEGLSGKADPDKFSNRLYVPNLYTYVLGSVASKTSHKQMPLYLPSGSVPPIVLKENER